MLMSSPPLRVGHLTPTYFSDQSVLGGGERYVCNLVKAVEVAAAAKGVDIQQEIVSIGTKPGFFTIDGLPTRLLENCSSAEEHMSALPAGLWDILPKFDLVHIHQSLTPFGEFVTAVASSLGIPILATDLGGGESPLMLQGKGLDLAHCVVSISCYAKSLIDSYREGPHDVIIGPVDTDYFTPAPAKGRREGYAICVNRLLPHKGIDRILEALPNDMPIKVVGQAYDPNYFSLLQKLAEGKKVTFIRDADDEDLLQLYRNADFFIQASTHKDVYGNVIRKPELMGLTTLEAMACGLPAIVSDAGSLPELIPNERVGRIFSDQDELRQILLEVQNRSWPAPDAGDIARRHVVKHYSFLNVGRKFLRLYQELTDTEKTRRTAA